MKRILMILFGLFLLVPFTVAQEENVTPLPFVTALGETIPTPGNGASDVAIWLHPTDLTQSTIIGADDQGALIVYDLSGQAIQLFEGLGIEGVDLRYNVPMGDALITLVVAGVSNEKRLLLYQVDATGRNLTALNEIPINVRIDSLCLYHSAAQGKFYVFVTTDYGVVEQYELSSDATGMQATQVRQFNVGGELEGCVADDALGQLYITEQGIALWKYGAEPDAGIERRIVDVSGGANLSPEIEGVSLYTGLMDTGYLLISNQGTSSFAVYERSGDNPYIGTFEIQGGDTIDGVNRSVALDIVNVPLNEQFPAGLMVVADNFNGEENRNFKLVSWGSIAETLGLMVDTRFDPQMIGR